MYPTDIYNEFRTRNVYVAFENKIEFFDVVAYCVDGVFCFESSGEKSKGYIVKESCAEIASDIKEPSKVVEDVGEQMLCNNLLMEC